MRSRRPRLVTRAIATDVGPLRTGAEPWVALGLLVVASLISRSIHSAADDLQSGIAEQSLDHARIEELRQALHTSAARAGAAPTTELPSGRILTITRQRGCAALVQMSPAEPPR